MGISKMKLNKILIVSLLLLAIVTMGGAVSASEDISDDSVAAVEPTDDAVSQPVDEIEQADGAVSQSVDEIEPTDELNSANDCEILTKDISDDAYPIWPDESVYSHDSFPNIFSVGEKFHVGVRLLEEYNDANGTFNVYYAGFNDFDYYKYNETVLASGNITNGTGIAELSMNKAGNPIYTVDYQWVDFWIEFNTNKGNGHVVCWTTIIENKDKISVTITPEEFVEGGNNNATLKFSSPFKGYLRYYVDDFYQYDEDLVEPIKSKEIDILYLSVGTHNIRVVFDFYDKEYGGFDGYFSKTLTVTVLPWTYNITQLATKLTPTKVTATYNVDKSVTFTLKDENGHILAGEKVTVTFNGNTYNKWSDSYGKLTFSISGLVPKTYKISVKIVNNESYKAPNSVSIGIYKATPKLITAAKKTFKVKAKTKKITATLKNNKGKVLKNVKLTLKIGKTTYTKKTNSKGVATFSVKLTKKGKYTGYVKFAGTKYYKALTKKVAIKVTK